MMRQAAATVFVALLLAACSREAPRKTQLTDPCEAIAFDGSRLNLEHPTEEMKEKWQKQCDDMRREQAGKEKQ